MKPILLKSTFGLILLLVGYLIGTTNSTQSFSDPKEGTSGNTAIVNPIIQPAKPLAVETCLSRGSATKNADTSNVDIDRQLSDLEADVRLNALFFLWRNHRTNQFHNEIARLASEDRDSQVKSFAQWIEGISVESIITEPQQTNILLTDYDNPENQIRESLIENPYQFQQTNELLDQDQSLLDSMQLLTEEQQLARIKELTELQDDAAVSALCELMVHYDPILQNAAIEALISMLELRTGHFDMIATSLEQNHVYLSDEQLERFHSLTQSGINVDEGIEEQSDWTAAE